MSEDRPRALADYDQMADLYADDAAVDPIKVSTTVGEADYLRFARRAGEFTQGTMEMLGTILVVVLILMLLGAVPTWNHSRSWGYFPSGGLGVLVLVLVVLMLMGRI